METGISWYRLVVVWEVEKRLWKSGQWSRRPDNAGDTGSRENAEGTGSTDSEADTGISGNAKGTAATVDAEGTATADCGAVLRSGSARGL